MKIKKHFRYGKSEIKTNPAGSTQLANKHMGKDVGCLFLILHIKLTAIFISIYQILAVA